jgi:hypothetical protein
MMLVNNTQTFKKAKKVITQNFSENPDELLSFKMGVDSTNYPEDHHKKSTELYNST